MEKMRIHVEKLSDIFSSANNYLSFKYHGVKYSVTYKDGKYMLMCGNTVVNSTKGFMNDEVGLYFKDISARGLAGVLVYLGLAECDEINTAVRAFCDFEIIRQREIDVCRTDGYESYLFLCSEQLRVASENYIEIEDFAFKNNECFEFTHDEAKYSCQIISYDNFEDRYEKVYEAITSANKSKSYSKYELRVENVTDGVVKYYPLNCLTYIPYMKWDAVRELSVSGMSKLIAIIGILKTNELAELRNNTLNLLKNAMERIDKLEDEIDWLFKKNVLGKEVL